MRFGENWKYKDATPSDDSIFMSKIIGVMALIVGLAFVVLGFIWDKI